MDGVNDAAIKGSVLTAPINATFARKIAHLRFRQQLALLRVSAMRQLKER